MNIVVCVKQVPDTWAERKLKSDGTLDRASVDGLINELDEYAIEEGLQIAEAQRAAGNEAEVTILTMGPEKASRVDPQGAVHGRGQGRVPAGRRPGRLGCAVDLLRARPGAHPDRLRPGDLRVGVDRRPDGRDGRDAGRAARRAAGLAGQQGGDRRLGHPHPPGLRRRVLRGHLHAARGDQRGREDQRAPLPLLQGDHGGEEEAGPDALPRRRGHRPGRGRAGAVRPPRWSITPSARRARSAPSSRTKATAASRSPSSSPRRSSSESRRG